MSLESGGRADKRGNEYENRYLARLLLRVINEEIHSVTVEPLGEFSDSVEFISKAPNNLNNYYQCKSSNGTKQNWTFSDLKEHHVFSRIKNILTQDTFAQYHFISPLPYNEIDELCNRARSCGTSNNYLEYSLTNEKLRSSFKDCAEAFELDADNEEELKQLVNILARCYFELVPYTETAKEDLESLIGLTFTGKSELVRVLLENFANSLGKIGVEITANEIINRFKDNDYYLRKDINDKRAIQKIHELNCHYWNKCPNLNGKWVHRTETTQIVTDIENGASIILHGHAGAGKSGCIQDVIDYLDKSNILYLAIKLDKFTPDGSADKFGETLGLRQSPVISLTNLAASKHCVLILDQLDALRWSCNHSSIAIDVCKEIISQAKLINTYQNGKISIIFASRSIDLESDPGLVRLFAENDSDMLKWRKYKIDNFSEDEVIQIIGTNYNYFPMRLKKLLRAPSALYVWTKLPHDKIGSNILSFTELMDIWWKQIEKQSVDNTWDAIVKCKDKIVASMENCVTFALPRRLFQDDRIEIDRLISCGILQSNPQKISFTHQSFFDYFVSCKMLNDLYSGKVIDDVIPSEIEQTPNVRYRLLVILHELINSDQDFFVRHAEMLLQSPNVRDYFKCCVFEVIGQCDEADDKLFSFLDKYYEMPEWKDYIVQVVYKRHPVFVKHLANSHPEWLTEPNSSILRTIADIVPDYITELLRPYANNCLDNDRLIYSALLHDISNETENAFSFRLELLKRHPEFLNDYFSLYELIKQKSARAVELLLIILDNHERCLFNQIYLDNEMIIEYAKANYKLIIDRLFNVICIKTKDYLPTWPYSRGVDCTDFADWTHNDYHDSTIRMIVVLTKQALCNFAKNSPNDFNSFVGRIIYPISGIGHEMIMAAMSQLPISHSDSCVNWLLSDFKSKAFVFSSDQSDYLKDTKQIIEIYSPHCSESVFQKLEHTICNWHDDIKYTIEHLKFGINLAKTERMFTGYCINWGHFQKSVLPYMDDYRLSKYAKELIAVLNRNQYIRLPHYGTGISYTNPRIVVSPIDLRNSYVSDNTWLRIISIPVVKLTDKWREEHTNKYWIESNHYTFSSSMGNQASKDPIRFAKLSLSFPENCYDGYIVHILYALETASSEIVSEHTDIVFQVIRYYFFKTERITRAILSVIRKHAQVEWPEDVYKLLNSYINNRPNIHSNDNSIIRQINLSSMSPLDILTYVLNNSVYGCAFYAIAELVTHHPDLGNLFKAIVENGSNDEDIAIRASVMLCAVSYYNIDSSFSVNLFKTLISKDLHILSFPGAWDILSRSYCEHQIFYRSSIKKAINSSNNELAEYAAV